MSRFWHGVVHVLAVVGQGAVAASHAIPAPYNYIVTSGIAAVQGIVALWHHTTPTKS